MSGWEEALMVASSALPAAQWRAALEGTLAQAEEVVSSAVLTSVPEEGDDVETVTINLVASTGRTLGAIRVRLRQLSDEQTVRMRLADVCAVASHTLETALDLAAHVRMEQPALSSREREVADLVCAGFSDLNIAAQLKISEATVGTHLNKIYRKLRVHSRVELARKMGGV